jgi:hypothetical protein
VCCVGISGLRLREIGLRNAVPPDLDALGPVCAGLRSLTLSFDQDMGALHETGLAAAYAQVGMLASSCQQLRYLHFGARSWSLDRSRSATAGRPAVSWRFPRLRSLFLGVPFPESWSGDTLRLPRARHVTTFDVLREQLSDLLQMSAHLLAMQLFSCSPVPAPSLVTADHFQSVRARTAPALQRLDLCGSWLCTVGAVRAIAATWPRLRTLSFTAAADWGIDDVLALLTSLPLLEACALREPDVIGAEAVSPPTVCAHGTAAPSDTAVVRIAPVRCTALSNLQITGLSCERLWARIHCPEVIGELAGHTGAPNLDLADLFRACPRAHVWKIALAASSTCSRPTAVDAPNLRAQTDLGVETAALRQLGALLAWFPCVTALTVVCPSTMAVAQACFGLLGASRITDLCIEGPDNLGPACFTDLVRMLPQLQRLGLPLLVGERETVECAARERDPHLELAFHAA